MSSEKRSITTWVSSSNLQSKIAELFYSVGLLNDNDEVVDIVIGDDNHFPKLSLLGSVPTQQIPVQIEIKKEVRTELVEHGK